MTSRDPHEKIGMVNAISQLAGFSPNDTDNVMKVLQEADQGVLSKIVGFTRNITSSNEIASPNKNARRL